MLADEEEGAEGGGGSDDDLTGDLDAALSSSLGGGVSSNLAAAAATPPHQGGSQAEGGSLREEEGESGLAYSYNEEIDDSVTGHGPALDAYAQTQVGGGGGRSAADAGLDELLRNDEGGAGGGVAAPLPYSFENHPTLSRPRLPSGRRKSVTRSGLQPRFQAPASPSMGSFGTLGGVSRRCSRR